MKKIFLVSLAAISIFCISFSFRSTYYIYINPKDTLFQKAVHNHGGSIYYLCNCYARKDALEFTFRDTSKTYTSHKLPPKTYSMLEFGKVANKMRDNFKNHELWQSEIYIVEPISRHKYHYYQVQFYPIEGDE